MFVGLKEIGLCWVERRHPFLAQLINLGGFHVGNNPGFFPACRDACSNRVIKLVSPQKKNFVLCWIPRSNNATLVVLFSTDCERVYGGFRWGNFPPHRKFVT